MENPKQNLELRRELAWNLYRMRQADMDTPAIENAILLLAKILLDVTPDDWRK